MTFRSRDFGAVLLAAGLVATACQSTATSTTAPLNDVTPTVEVVETVEATATVVPAPTVAEEQTAAPAAADESALPAEPLAYLHPDLETAVRNLADGYRTVESAWAGFSPNDHPVVLAVKAVDDQLLGAITINYDNPDVLGEAVVLDTAGTPFGSLHLVTMLDVDATIALQDITTFEFNADVGGTDVFLMIAGGSDGFFDPTTKSYVSTLLHELFHRYQEQTFAGPFIDQDIDGYDYSPRNLELIALEDRALAAALGAADDEDRRRAANHVVAIRHARMVADPRILLDSIQEMREGTARFVEHQVAGADTSYGYHDGNYERALITDIPSNNVKSQLAFGRWYASGAAILRVLRQLDAVGIEASVESGAAPITVLAQMLDADEAEFDDLVAEARALYDPTNELPEQAERAAEAVLAEPPFWSGIESTDGDTSDADAIPTIILTDELIACLEERGVDFDVSPFEASGEDIEACNGEFS